MTESIDPISSEPFIRRVVVILRRRARWSILGLLGGMLGAALTTLGMHEPPPPQRYFKATETRVQVQIADDPTLVTTFSLSQIPSFLHTPQSIARIAAAIDLPAYQVTAQIGVGVRSDVGAIEVTAIALDADEAVRLASQSAKVLSEMTTEASRATDAARRAELEAQRTRFRQQNDELVRQLADEPENADLIQVKIQFASTSYAAVDAELAALGDPPPMQLETLTPPRAIEINASGYFARVSNNQGMVDANQTATRTGASTVNELDLPVPESPSKRNRILLGGVAGLVVGVFAALLADTWDDRVRGRTSVARLTTRPLLAEIPHLSRAQRRAIAGRGVTDASQQLASLFQGVRSSLLVALGLEVGQRSPEGAQVVLVTSPAAREGRTLTVAGLAGALSDIGLRTLVVDGDLRHPTVGRILGAIPNLVDAHAPWTTRTVDVDFLPAPSRRLDLADAVNEVRATIEAHRDDYDVILLDAAPLLITNDAADYLVTSCDLVVAVWRDGTTPVESARKMLDIVDRFDVALAGIVLNDCEVPELESWLGGITADHDVPREPARTSEPSGA